MILMPASRQARTKARLRKSEPLSACNVSGSPTELWRTSGRPPPIKSSSARNERKASANMDLIEFLRGKSDRKAMKVISRNSLLFPIEDHLVQLLQAGKIKSLGKRPSERRRQELSAADWMGLEIAELVGLSVTKSEATCLFVMLSRPDVLREFPALPVEPKSPSTERPEPDDSSAQRNRGERGDTDPSGGREKFARKAGVTEGREKIREALKALGGSSTTGTTKKSR